MDISRFRRLLKSLAVNGQPFLNLMREAETNRFPIIINDDFFTFQDMT